MNDTNSPAVIDESPPTIQPTDEAPVSPGSERRAVPVLALVTAVLALIVSVGLAVSAYFIWYRVQQLDSEQAGIESGVSDRIQPLRSTLDGVSEALRQERSALETRIDRLGEDQQATGHRLSVLAALIGRSERGWTLAEVEYLLRIANQRLQLQRDTGTAVQALRAADGRLRDLADPHYQSVREQIAQDLDAVRAVPAVDVEGLSATLGSALQQIDELPVAGTHYTPAAGGKTDSDGAEKTATSAEQLGTLVWQSLSELFRVREHDQPVGPMLPPDREYFLRENLRLQLAAARLALLRNDPAQYRAALQTSLDWLNRYFDGQAATVGQLLGQLQEIASIDITPALPDVSASLRLLRQQMQLSEQPAVLPVVPAAAGEQQADAGEASASAEKQKDTDEAGATGEEETGASEASAAGEKK
jgi:uroporphyrin-3 C-methyltransferase